MIGKNFLAPYRFQHKSERIAYFVLTLMLLSGILAGQTRQIFVNTKDKLSYEYLNYQMTHGTYMPAFALQQPFSLPNPEDIDSTIAAIFLREHWQRQFGNKEFTIYSEFGGDLFHGGSWRKWLHGNIRFTYANEWITLVNSTAIDEKYKYDANFAGDLSKSQSWIYGRVEEAYININLPMGMQFFYGRMPRNWGPINSYSLLLSDYAYSFDHLLFSYTHPFFRLSLIAAQLDNMDGLSYTDEETITAYSNASRYLVGHRLDIRISDDLQFALSETGVYGGEGRGWEWEFLNPMQFFYAIQRNDGKLINPRWSLDASWKPAKKWALYSQLHLDDIIVNNDPGINARAKYPDRLALNLSIRNADLILLGMHTQVDYTRIWNRTYQSRNTYENYIYRGLALGYPAASLEEISISFSYWNIFPFVLRNRFIYGRYGDVQPDDVFTLDKEPFPVPPTIHNIYNRTELDFFYGQRLQASIYARYLANPIHYENRYSLNEQWLFGIKLKVLISGSWDIVNPKEN
jgi:hypothetical protein